jgi:hypothetical protein
MGAPHAECFRVSFQSFGSRQRNARRSDALNSCARNLLAANDAHEIKHAEAAAHPRHRTRGQHVVRSGDVVARSLRCELVEENRARMLHSAPIRRKREMLGRDAIRRFDRLLQRIDVSRMAPRRESDWAAIGLARVRFCTSF